MGRHPVMVRQVCPLIPFNVEQNHAFRAMAEFVWREDSALELNFSLYPKVVKDNNDLLNLFSDNSCKTALKPTRLDHLWRHTCFEAFLAIPGETQYWEMNASPKGDWNLYRFSDYRIGGVAESQAKPPLVSLISDRFGLHCTIEMQLKPWWHQAVPPELALTMVLEETNGSLSYWALSHHGDEPDFHDRRSFLHC